MATSALNQLFNYTDATIVILFVDDPMPLLKVIESTQSIRALSNVWMTWTFLILNIFKYDIIALACLSKGIFKDILDGVTLGYVSLDVCQSPTRAGNLVANIHSRNLELKYGNTVISPTRFDLYVGPMDSETSVRVADGLHFLQ
jgi:hypothetical protein